MIKRLITAELGFFLGNFLICLIPTHLILFGKVSDSQALHYKDTKFHPNGIIQEKISNADKIRCVSQEINQNHCDTRLI